jgi:hypothetical protein
MRVSRRTVPVAVELEGTAGRLQRQHGRTEQRPFVGRAAERAHPHELAVEIVQARARVPVARHVQQQRRARGGVGRLTAALGAHRQIQHAQLDRRRSVGGPAQRRAGDLARHDLDLLLHRRCRRHPSRRHRQPPPAADAALRGGAADRGPASDGGRGGGARPGPAASVGRRGRAAGEAASRQDAAALRSRVSAGHELDPPAPHVDQAAAAVAARPGGTRGAPRGA